MVSEGGLDGKDLEILEELGDGGHGFKLIINAFVEHNNSEWTLNSTSIPSSTGYSKSEVRSQANL